MGDILEVCELEVSYPGAGGARVAALQGVSFTVGEAESVGMLGESGGGKSTAALAILGLLPRNAWVSGSVRWRSRDLLALPDRELERVRGAEIALIFQEPGGALHPMMRAGDQVFEAVRAHRKLSRAECRDEAREALQAAGFRDTARVYGAYPHELSGGQRQRVAIAQALACRPKLLIADEPTASLDPESAAEILALLRDLRARRGLALLLISHKPAALEEAADRILVMYAGRIVERGAAANICRDPMHPYTRALLECGRAKDGRLRTIEGEPPDPSRPAAGCSFEPRCTLRQAVCGSRTPRETRTETGAVLCFWYGG